MHIPDGFLSPPVWATLGAASAGSIALVSRRVASAENGSRAPLMGVLGAFVFAAQMINFPVGVGASGHLVGGALLTAALGPAAASITLTAILIVQALIFQDGGLLALGANVFNMAMAGVLAAWLPWRALASRNRQVAAFLAGFSSVLVSACLCLVELSLSGHALPSAALMAALGVFLITAVLEGAITAGVLGALERMNPAWVSTTNGSRRPVLVLLTAASLLLACVGALFASSLPDGLEHFAEAARISDLESVLFHSPLPDYDVLVLQHPWLGKSLAGLAGLAVTFLLCAAIAAGLRRRRNA